MKKKVILISVDGMRPDGFLQCGHPYVEEILNNAYYTLDGQTVYPSITLPCHMSLFYSVTPERHGMLGNIYSPMVRPFDGLFERLQKADAVSAMYYGWEPLREVSRPGALKYAEYMNTFEEESVDTILTERAIARIQKCQPDFVFLYMVDTDDKGGHDYGWMTEEYFKRVSIAVENIKHVIETCGKEYTIIITADHGGHGRNHGDDIPEDMTIPMFYIGEDFEKGVRFSKGSIVDIAPTIAHLMGITVPREWEGKSVI